MWSVAFAPDGKTFVCSQIFSKRVDVWDAHPSAEALAASRYVKPLRSHEREIFTVQACVLTGDRIASFGLDGSVAILGAKAAPQLLWPTPKHRATAAAVSRDGAQLAAVREGALFVWDVPSPR